MIHLLHQHHCETLMNPSSHIQLKENDMSAHNVFVWKQEPRCSAIAFMGFSSTRLLCVCLAVDPSIFRSLSPK